jgi:predicted AlkP superfamily phosphohydrolase/phosphomutase
MTKTVVIGLDGAAWHLIDPMIDAGIMPHLGALKSAGASGALTSTVPTYTPPAWTSSVTGVGPGKHGIYGFIEGHVQFEKPRLTHSGMIKATTLWEMANAQGARTGIYNLPLTYPPQQLDGWMVAGMLTPGYGEKQTGFAYPKTIEPRILDWAPDYVLDVNANYELDWKDDDLARRALHSIHQRRDVLRGLLETDPVDLLFTVMETPDRLQHVYYRYLDPSDKLYDSAEGRRLRPAVWECFAALDEIVGLLNDYAGDGGVIVCSDHGFTAWEVSVHLNALLEHWGYLKLKPQAKAMQTSLARKMVSVAKRVLPRKLARDAKGKTFGAIDWSQTRAFASPIPQQGIFVNLEGRERLGIVPPSELEDLKAELAARFMGLDGPDGDPATDRVHKSEEVFGQDPAPGAPDVLPVLRDHRFELDDELFHKRPFTDVSGMPRGVHHPEGIIVVKGAGVRAGDHLRASVLDITPTLLYMAGLGVPEGLEGGVVTEAFEDAALVKRPISMTSPLSSGGRDETSPYSDEEEADIEEALRGLGYL